MMTIGRILCVCWLVALALPTANAQQDDRIQKGDILDANPGVGTSGLNSGVQTGSTINSQLYVGGRVTGLARFRGNVPYSQVGSLQLNLPGSSVRSFERASVGLQEATSGQAYRTSAYLDRTQTVMGLRGIQSGLTVPGSNMPRYSTLPPQVANELYTTAVRRYEPLMDLQSLQQPLITSPVQSPLTPPVVLNAGQVVPDRFSEGYRPGTGAVLSLPWQEDREKLLAELNEIRRDRGAEAQLGYDAEVPEKDTRVGTPITGQPTVADQPSTILAQSRSAMPRADQDAFHDLLMAIRLKEVEAAESLDDQSQSTLVTEGPSGELTIQSLAGRNADMFNRFISEAQKLLAAGRYYDADVRFTSAEAANPQNPIAQVGSSLAMFAAGEPVTAAYRLYRAMEVFPPIMETQLAARSLMDSDIFDRRLAELDNTLGEQTPSDNQMLLMLAAYMHTSAGQDSLAKEFAKRLQDVATDPLLAAYAEFILTGERPDQQSLQQQDGE